MAEGESKKRDRGRPKLWEEELRLPLRAGTIARLDAARAESETRLDVIREAIARELKRREKAKPKE